MKQEKKTKQIERKMVVGTPTECSDTDCYIHGNLKLRGRVFEGVVTKKFPRRIVIEFGRMLYNQKYERYSKAKTKLHARVPHCQEEEVNVGDYVQIKECRPLSKIIHFSFVKVIRKSEQSNGGKKK